MKPRTVIIGDNFAEELAHQLNLEAILVEERIFFDGEIQPRLLQEKKAEQIILILQKKADQGINDYLIEYLLLARKAKDLAKKVLGIMPYLPYTRQDAIFEEGEPLSALYLAELIEQNLALFLTFNMHEHRKRIRDLFTIPAYNVSLFQDLAKKFQEFDPQQTIVLGPDREAKTFVDDFCSNFPAEKIIFLKQRNTKTGQITFSYPKLNLKDKDVIIVDDLVSTGGTILAVAKIVKKFQARSISFAFVHPVLGDQSFEALKVVHPKKIITTNTISNSYFELDLIEPLARFLKQELKI